jgi:hypothetical protein
MSRRPKHPQVVTANRLLEGDVVWLTADDRWTTRVAEAELIDDPAIAEARLLDAMGQADAVVGAYLAGMGEGPSGPEPVHFREATRIGGPGPYTSDAASGEIA